jgi:hypothetical protein
MDYIFVPLIILLGFLFITSFKNKISENNLLTLRKLYLYHIAFGIYYCFFVQGDAIGYWSQAKFMSDTDFIYSLTQNQGTYFIYALNYYPSNIFDLSYFTGTILYSLIGFIGLTYFYVMAIELIPNDPKFKEYHLFPLLFFLPNLHFWSCSIGKDTLLFFCIAIFTYGLMLPIKRLPMIIIGLVLSYFIRPHITLFILLGFGVAYFSGKNISLLQRVLFIGAMIGLAVVLLPNVMEFARIEEASVDDFDKFAVNKAELLSRSHTDTAIDISSYPFPLKVLSFLYRPFFFDINGIPSVLASLENMILLALSFTVLINKPLQTFRNTPFVIQGMIYFLIIGTLVFSQTLGNIGIMIRMRNMFLPGLLIFILWHFSFVQSEEEQV